MADLSVQSFEVIGPANTNVFSVNNTGTVAESQGLTITAAGETITAGGLTITAGGLTVTAGGATITAGGLTVTAGGLTVSAGGLTVSAGTQALLGAILQLGLSATIPTPTGAAQTIATNTGIVSRTAPSGACTNAILQAGTQNGQIVIVTNENVASTANTITFNTTIATSFVANDGTNAEVIKCGTAKMFIWLSSLNSSNGAWVSCGPFAG